MKLALVGSMALSEHISINRTHVDIDMIGSYGDMVAFAKSNGATSFVPINNGKYIKMTFDMKPSIFEAEVAWEGSSAEALLKYIENDPKSRIIHEGIIPSLNFLYMLKMSHRFLRNSPHFLKTMKDIHLMRQNGAFIEYSLKTLYKARQKETYNYGHPKLNQNKMDFFKGDGVKYVYDHDSIHEAIKVHERPAYTYFKKDNEEVSCSKALFEACDRSIQLAATYEESCVLAIERSLVPFPGVMTPQKAFETALMKVCTSITSGWFREFSWENYFEVLKIDPEFTFWDKFQRAVSAGKVPEHTIFDGVRY